MSEGQVLLGLLLFGLCMFAVGFGLGRLAERIKSHE